MSKLSLALGVILITLLSFIGGNKLEQTSIQNQDSYVGSVQRTGEYYSTTTPSGAAAYQYKIASSTSILGSVVITSSTASAIWIYNWDGVGTMTASGTLVAYFPTNAAAGTYTFDIQLNKGLYTSTTAANTGVYAVTFR